MVLAYFIPALRIVLSLLFVITSVRKLPDLKPFSVIVASYGVLPRKLVKPAAYSQPIIELIIGLWILSGRYLFQAAIAGLLMMIVANYFVLTALIKKKKMDNCGCYGVKVKVPLTWNKFYENLVWTGLFILLILATMQFR